MINPGSTRNENNKEHNEKWPFISHHSYRILIIGGSGSGKINVLLDLIKEQDDIDTIYLYAKDSSEPKYEFLIKSAKLSSLEIVWRFSDHFNDPNVFIECSNTMDKVYENIDNYNPNRKRNILIVFDDMIADIMTNKKFQTTIK